MGQGVIIPFEGLTVPNTPGGTEEQNGSSLDRDSARTSLCDTCWSVRGAVVEVSCNGYRVPEKQGEVFSNPQTVVDSWGSEK